MAISKQLAVVVDRIVSYKPTTWLSATISELESIPVEDHAKFGEALINGIAAYKVKVQNAASILQRGPNLNPEVNLEAWSLMHARYLARLFIKHPTLCSRLCVKLENETYNPGWRLEVNRLRNYESHKWEIEAQVEDACRKSQLNFSTHSDFDIQITYNNTSTVKSQSRAEYIRQVETHRRQPPPEYLVALSQSDPLQSMSFSQSVGTDSCTIDEDKRDITSQPPRQMFPQMGIFNVAHAYDRPSTSSSQAQSHTRKPKHVRFALAVEKNATAELEAIANMDVNSLYFSSPERAHQLRLKRQRQTEPTFEEDDLYGVSDEEHDRNFKARSLKKGKGVENSATESPRPVSIRQRSTIESELLDSDDEGHLTPSDSDATISDNGKGVGGESPTSSRQSPKLSAGTMKTTFAKRKGNMKAGIDGEAGALDVEDNAQDEGSSPVESIDGDNEERFSLREMIDVMEYLAEHPYVCENGMVDHVWDEYKLFHEYNTEALKVAEEEIEEMQRAASNEGISTTLNGKVVKSAATAHRTRSTTQAVPAYTPPPHRVAPSVPQEQVAHGVEDNEAIAADKAKRISAAVTASYRNRNFQLQVAAVYEALPNHAPASVGSAPEYIAPPRRAPSSHSTIPAYTAPTRRDPASAGPAPEYIAPPRRAPSSHSTIPAYTAPMRRSSSSARPKATDVNHPQSVNKTKKGVGAFPSTSPSQNRKMLQIAAVLNALGRQNESASGSDGAGNNDGEAESVVTAAVDTRSRKTRSRDLKRNFDPEDPDL